MAPELERLGRIEDLDAFEALVSDFEGSKEEYGLGIDPEQVMLFDPESGEQIGSSTAVRRKKFGG